MATDPDLNATETPPDFPIILIDPINSGTGVLEYSWTAGNPAVPYKLTSKNINVSAGALDKFVVANENLTGEVAGTPLHIDRDHERSRRNHRHGYGWSTGIPLNFSLVGSTATTTGINPIMPTSGSTYNFTNGVLNIPNLTLYNVLNTPVINVTSVGANPKLGVSDPITIKHGKLDRIVLKNGITNTFTAGSTGTWDVVASDLYGNPVNSDVHDDNIVNRPITITLDRSALSDPSAQITATTLATATVLPAREVIGTLSASGQATLTVTTIQSGSLSASAIMDTVAPGIATGASEIDTFTVHADSPVKHITVLEGEVYKQGVAGYGADLLTNDNDPLIQRTAGAVFDVEVRIVDQYFNTVTAYNGGSVSLSSNDSQSKAAQPFSFGVSTFSVTHSVTGTDLVWTPTVSTYNTGWESKEFDVYASAPTKLAFEPAPGTPVAAGSLFLALSPKLKFKTQTGT